MILVAGKREAQGSFGSDGIFFFFFGSAVSSELIKRLIKHKEEECSGLIQKHMQIISFPTLLPVMLSFTRKTC